MTNSSDKVIKDLERKLSQLEVQLKELNQRVRYLERENSRRKSEVSQVTTVLRKVS